MKSLVIAEKTFCGKRYCKSFTLQQKHSGSTRGDKYIVTWALGHLVTLADPEEYDKKYSKWDMETLPMMPEKCSLLLSDRRQSNMGW